MNKVIITSQNKEFLRKRVCGKHWHCWRRTFQALGLQLHDPLHKL